MTWEAFILYTHQNWKYYIRTILNFFFRSHHIFMRRPTNDLQHSTPTYFFFIFSLNFAVFQPNRSGGEKNIQRFRTKMMMFSYQNVTFSHQNFLLKYRFRTKILSRNQCTCTKFYIVFSSNDDDFASISNILAPKFCCQYLVFAPKWWRFRLN